MRKRDISRKLKCKISEIEIMFESIRIYIAKLFISYQSYGFTNRWSHFFCFCESVFGTDEMLILLISSTMVRYATEFLSF